MNAPRKRRPFRWLPSLRRVEREIDDELRFHFESRINDLIAAGHAPDDARRIADAEYGDVEASREELVATDRRILSRERRADWIDIVRQDLGFALRDLKRRPGFTAGVALTLALAVGANGAVFALIDPLLFRPPPGVADPRTVVRLYTNSPKAPHAVDGRWVGQYFSYPAFRSLRTAAGGLAEVAAYRPYDSSVVRRGADSLYANLTYTTANFLPALGVHIARGRSFSESDDDVDTPAAVCVVSDAFAKRAFGDVESSLGETMTVRGSPCTVIGVAGPEFQGIAESATDIWAPFSGQPHYPDSRHLAWYRVQDTYIPIIARLEPGADVRALAARATVALARSLDRPIPSYEGRSVLIGPLIEARGPMAEQQEVAIGTRLAAVAGIVLLIACANIANLYLVRAIRRRRETAVRLALGISRARLASQFFVEGLSMACIAGAAAMLIAGWGGSALRAALLPRVHWIGGSLGLRVFFFSAACALGGSLVAAIVPAILASRPELVESLKAGARDGTVARSRLRSALLALQAGLSVVLIVGAALFVESLRNVRLVDLGFDTKQLIISSLYFSDGGDHAEGTLLPEIAARLSAYPGVTGASYASGGPLVGWSSGVPLYVPHRDSAITGAGHSDFIGVPPEYFTITKTRIVAGRGFLATDRRDAAPVMVVSQMLAEAFWPGESAIGKCLIPDDRTNPCFTIVGVAKDVHQFSIVYKSQLHFYLPLDQVSRVSIHEVPRRNKPNALFVSADPAARSRVTSAIRADLSRAFPTAQIRVSAVPDILAPQLVPWQLGAQLFGAMGLLSLFVAAVGIYSVVSFAVQQRTHEMGVRIALGARALDLVRMVVGRITILIATGVGLGIVAAALIAGRFVASLLYGISPRDPLAAIVSAVVLLLVGFAASVGPAWRASRLDPSAVLREE